MCVRSPRQGSEGSYHSDVKTSTSLVGWKALSSVFVSIRDVVIVLLLLIMLFEALHQI